MTSEIGYQAPKLAGWADISAQAHEPNPDLVWPASIEVYDKMRSEDSQVGSVIRAVTLPIRSARWAIDANGASEKVTRFVAETFNLNIRGQAPIQRLRTKGRFSWDEHLRLALLELVFGHSFFEQVYEPAEEGRLTLRKLAWRPPRTISNIKVASDGGLESISQYGIPGHSEVTIPVSRLVAYVNEREGSNWLGRSLLRTAYKNWLLKDRLLRIQALVGERNGLGIPVYKGTPAPEQLSAEEQRKWMETQRDEGLELVKGLRAGETAGASIPSGSELSLMGVQGKLPDTDGPIRYHDEQIARAVLAHFLNLGTETGSWALGSTFANFFTDSLNAVATHIEDVTQQHIVEDLVDLNWGKEEPAPRLVCEPIGSEHPATAEAIKSLIESHAVTPDADLEEYMRQRYGLPNRDPETVREAPDSISSDGEDKDLEETE